MEEGLEGELEAVVRLVRVHRRHRRAAGKKHIYYPRELRERIVRLMRRGVQRREIFRATGVLLSRLSEWNREHSARGKTPFMEVKVVASSSDMTSGASNVEGELTLAGKNGILISGLGIHHIIKLMEAGLL